MGSSASSDEAKARNMHTPSFEFRDSIKEEKSEEEEEVKPITSKKESFQPGDLTKIITGHPEFELTYDMMLGIYHLTSTTMYHERKRLSSANISSEVNLEGLFNKTVNLKFPSQGTSRTPAHRMGDFEFKDYMPEIFLQLREWFGIDNSDYLVNLCGDFKYLDFVSNSQSGSFFFYSHDTQYMIKTIQKK